MSKRDNSSRNFRRNGQIKAHIRAARKQEEQDRLTTPQKSDALLRGYEKTMRFLSRGCDVQAA